ncbi:MAG: zinc-dependent alcohol dehydrogenase family protein [Dokdonella sp.]
MQKTQYSSRGPVPQDVIDVVDFELPGQIAAGHARVEVLAAPVNPSDVLTLTGEYGILPPLPAVGGNEGVGRVIAVADDVTKLPVGQTVLLPVSCGTWTTHLDLLADSLVALPNDADPKQLAMMTVNPPTASLLLSDIVDLQAGDWVIQNAANSAVGGYVIAIAKSRGLRTVNIVRRESAIDSVNADGDVILVDGEDVSSRVRAATDSAKIRLGIDAVGGAATESLASCLANGGEIVNYGAMSGEPCQVSPMSLIFRGIRLRGFWLSSWYKNAEPAKRNALFAEIAKGIAKGELSARIQATFSLDQIKEAITLAASGERDGKIVLLPNG